LTFFRFRYKFKKVKDFLKVLLFLFAAGSAFLIGFYLGGEGIKSKIPEFQRDSEEESP